MASHDARAGTDRRSFLRTLAGAVAVTSAAPGALEAAAAPARSRLPALPAGATADEPYWELIKAQFAIRPGLVMMNAANLCPAPLPVTDAVQAMTRDIDADASFQNRARFEALAEEALEALAGYVGADADELVITRNTSEGNNMVVAGLELGPGDEVLVWDQNHPTNSEAWDVRARRDGFSVRRITTPVPADADALLHAFTGAITPRTRVLAFSHVSNVTGVALPAEALCRAARERGILTLVDGAQTFGAQSLDLHRLGCDGYTASAHKWFMGPKEAGLLYLRRDRHRDLWPAVVGVGWDGDGDAAHRFGTLGQRDDAAVAAMGHTVAFHQRVGADRVEARIRELATALVDGLARRMPDARFHTPGDPALRLGVVVVELPGVDPADGFQRLYDEHGIAGAPRGGRFPGIRLCPTIYNTLADVERVTAAVTALRG